MGNQQGMIDANGNIVNYKENFGYKVIQVRKDSPADKCGLEPFLDFVLYQPGITGERKLLFSEYISEHIGKSVCLRVYNLIQQGIRLVHLDLTQIVQPENGFQNIQEELLGAQLRYEQYDEAHLNILSVQDVFFGSPAQDAEFQPFKDFIIGTREMTFTDLPSFAKYIQVNEGQEIELITYNVDSESIRKVKLTPNSQWHSTSQQGLIGADISCGFLNRLPMRKRDIQNAKKREQMQGIFSGLAGNREVSKSVENSESEDEQAQQPVAAQTDASAIVVNSKEQPLNQTNDREMDAKARSGSSEEDNVVFMANLPSTPAEVEQTEQAEASAGAAQTQEAPVQEERRVLPLQQDPMTQNVQISQENLQRLQRQGETERTNSSSPVKKSTPAKNLTIDQDQQSQDQYLSTKNPLIKKFTPKNQKYTEHQNQYSLDFEELEIAEKAEQELQESQYKV